MSASKKGGKRTSGPKKGARPRHTRHSGRRIAESAAGSDGNIAPSVSRLALLGKDGDKRFRQLVYDLLTVSNRMSAVREHLGKKLKISAPQYSLLMAVIQLEGDKGVSVSALAKLLHVSTAFVATESGKLEQLDLVAKRADPDDGRAVRLSLTRHARALIVRNGDEIRAINDTFFGALDADAFATLSGIMAALVQSSDIAMAQINSSAALGLRVAAE
jgi:DNA-binding MarR family transcriptional regulator